ncbi:beta-1,3-galactosyl-O-glycosyl-glycoprotein beta-1,6-N-acetylglucosaminyltransferase activity [Sparganum proliferum]
MRTIIRWEFTFFSTCICCLLIYLLSTLFQKDGTVKKVLFDAHLKTFCENLNESTQPLPDYQTQYPHETDVFFASMSSPSHENCQRFRWAFANHERSPVAAREAAYPLAFTIVAHRNVRQLARLLRMIHRPANFYCIHIDRRSSAEFSQAVEGVATCFGPNVHVVPPESRVAVVWGNASVLKPQLVCAEAALRQSGWRYLLNLAAEEVPLRTNLEMIAAMQALNGSNLLEAVRIGGYSRRTKGVQLPNQMQWFKGSIYGAFRRDFLDFALHSSETQSLLQILFSDMELRNPDELFFQTVAFNPHIRAPGACLYIPLPSEVSEGYPASCIKFQRNLSGLNARAFELVQSTCFEGRIHEDIEEVGPHFVALLSQLTDDDDHADGPTVTLESTLACPQKSLFEMAVEMVEEDVGKEIPDDCGWAGGDTYEVLDPIHIDV